MGEITLVCTVIFLDKYLWVMKYVDMGYELWVDG